MTRHSSDTGQREREKWSQHGELNPGPTDYESVRHGGAVLHSEAAMTGHRSLTGSHASVDRCLAGQRCTGIEPANDERHTEEPKHDEC